MATNEGSFCIWLSEKRPEQIDKDEEESLKRLASHLLSLSAQALMTAKHSGELMEVDCYA